MTFTIAMTARDPDTNRVDVFVPVAVDSFPIGEEIYVGLTDAAGAVLNLQFDAATLDTVIDGLEAARPIRIWRASDMAPSQPTK